MVDSNARSHRTLANLGSIFALPDQMIAPHSSHQRKAGTFKLAPRCGESLHRLVLASCTQLLGVGSLQDRVGVAPRLDTKGVVREGVLQASTKTKTRTSCTGYPGRGSWIVDVPVVIPHSGFIFETASSPASWYLRVSRPPASYGGGVWQRLELVRPVGGACRNKSGETALKKNSTRIDSSADERATGGYKWDAANPWNYRPAAGCKDVSPSSSTRVLPGAIAFGAETRCVPHLYAGEPVSAHEL